MRSSLQRCAFLCGLCLDSLAAAPAGETILWPSAETELRAQPDSTLATLADGAVEVRTGVEAAFPGGMRDETDGLSLAFDDWRFNLRLSNTEPVIRLNVETRGNTQLLKEKTEQILKMLE